MEERREERRDGAPGWPGWHYGLVEGGGGCEVACGMGMLGCAAAHLRQRMYYYSIMHQGRVRCSGCVSRVRPEGGGGALRGARCGSMAKRQDILRCVEVEGCMGMHGDRLAHHSVAVHV